MISFSDSSESEAIRAAHLAACWIMGFGVVGKATAGEIDRHILRLATNIYHELEIHGPVDPRSGLRELDRAIVSRIEQTSSSDPARVTVLLGGLQAL